MQINMVTRAYDRGIVLSESAIQIANYIIENNATVRQTAKEFEISKSTVHAAVTKWNGFYG